MEALSKIEYAQVPTEYFKSLVLALQSARIYERVVIAYLGSMDYPDLGAEMADIFLRLRGIRWVVCIGIYKDLVMVSVRTRNRRGAGQLVQEITGSRGTAGGHGTMAGAQIPIRDEDPEQIASQLSRHALQYLKISSEVVGKSLI
jgi:nanoRNase/pAp phosphatase (c-di-AMP/oligoRNAs hydrolase)